MEDNPDPAKTTSEPMLKQTTDIISEPNEPANQTPASPAENFTPPPVPPVTAVPPPAKPKKRGLKVLMIAIVAAAVFGAGAFAYFGVYVPNQPENVVKTALANLLSADSAKIRGSAKLNWSNFSVSPTFTAEAAQDGGAAFGVQANLGGVDLAFEARQTADDAYFKLSGLTGLGNAWQDALAAYGFGQDQVATLNDLVLSVDDKWIAVNDVVQSAEQALPNLDSTALGTAFSDRAIIASADKVGEEMIENRSASQFKVSFNKDELKAGIDALNTEGLNDEQKNKLKQSVDQLNLNDISLWVYDDTKEFAKFTHAGNLGNSETDGSYELELIFVSFNQTPNIVAPTETINGLQLWLDLNNSLQLDQYLQQAVQGVSIDSLRAD